MTPLIHPTLVNGRFGDPALYVETLFERRALLFDLGEIAKLAPRNIQRIEHVFVSHVHIDHFIGFDHLLRVLVGREKTINLYGPDGFIDAVGHKLHAYRWNLVDRFASDLVFIATEIKPDRNARSARFRLKNAFEAEPLESGRVVGGVLHSEPTFRVVTEFLEHRTLCLGFALEESVHVNIWKNKLAEMGLPIGPWLRDLKQAVIEGRPDDHLIEIWSRPTQCPAQRIPVGTLRPAVVVSAGQKIGYVTDAAGTPQNLEAIIRLVQGADLLFIEAAFAEADAALAASRAHLTTAIAGRVARQAGVRRVEPFHFSARYAGNEQRMLDEVMAAFKACDG
jgi:ribonuclease Z